MDVGYITAPDVAMTFTDDQLSVTVTEDQLSNGLKLPSKTSNEGCTSAANNWSSTDTTVSSTTSSATCAASNHSSTRFKVGPTSVDQSLIYHQLPRSASDDQEADTMVPTTVEEVTAAGNNNSSDSAADSPVLSGRRERKKVSFPEGEALIKGFAHAPNPWYNVSFCTTENLVSAYVNSCNAHSVRPLVKLINQLKCVSDFGERINLLTLKGENLNCKHIETLEEIFRRVQFNTVDMSSTHLDDEAAIALFEMVEYYESVVHLKMSNNRNLGLRAWMSAARMLRRTQHLESIDLRGCSLNEQCMAILGRSIKLGACIHALYLQECNLSGRGVLIISAALRSISAIKELHIGDNNLQPSDGIQLGNLIRNNIYLHTLDVRNNHLQDIGIAHICDGLAAQPNGIGLKSLNISNNHFSPASMNVIAIALSRTKTLNTLNVSYNNLTNEGFFVLKEGLLKNKSLCRLALRSTKISDEGAVALAEYIADSYTISQLDLRDNDIKTAGLLAVSMCLKVQETITRLEIDQHVKKEPAVKDYATQQRFFLDELQCKVTQNAELQRAKLEKLLVQSKSEKSGPAATPPPPAASADSALAASEEKPTEELTQPNIDTLSKLPAEAGDADSSSYFDPLGAVSVEEGADSLADAGDIDGEESTSETADVVVQESVADSSVRAKLKEALHEVPSVLEDYSVNADSMEISGASMAGDGTSPSANTDIVNEPVLVPIVIDGSVTEAVADSAPPSSVADHMVASSDRKLTDEYDKACEPKHATDGSESINNTDSEENPATSCEDDSSCIAGAPSSSAHTTDTEAGDDLPVDNNLPVLTDVNTEETPVDLDQSVAAVRDSRGEHGKQSPEPHVLDNMSSGAGNDSTEIVPADICQPIAPVIDDVESYMTDDRSEKTVPTDTCHSVAPAIDNVVPVSSEGYSDEAPADVCQSLVDSHSLSAADDKEQELFEETSVESLSSTSTGDIRDSIAGSHQLVPEEG